MFCKYCGAALESEALFCTNCGKKIEPAAPESSSAGRQEGQAQQPSSDRAARDEKGGVNPLCIAGCILTGLSFFLNYYGFVALSAFFVSLAGYRKAKKGGQEGATLAIISMVISGVIFASFFIAYIQYSIYGYAAFGLINRFLSWLEDIL